MADPGGSVSTPQAPGRAVPGAGLAAACAAGFTVFLLALRGRPGAAQAVSDLGLLGVAAVAAVAGLRAGRRTPGRLGQMWTLLGLAAAAWAAGQAGWTWIETVEGRPVPLASAADAGYLVALVLFVAALLRVAGGLPDAAGGPVGRVRRVADGLLLVLSVLVVSWVLVLGPVVAATPERVVERLVVLAYPIGDAVVVVLVLHVLLRHREGLRVPAPLALLAAALLSLAAADSAFATASLRGAYASGSLLDAVWFLGFALLAAGAGSERRARAAGGVGSVGSAESAGSAGAAGARTVGIFLPCFAVLLAVVVSTPGLVGGGVPDPVLGWVRTALVVALVARQALALVENRALTTDLERRVLDRTAELSASRARFHALVHHSSDVTTVLDSEGVVLYQSDSGRRQLGHGTEIVGTSYDDLVDPADRPALHAALDEVLAEPLAATSVALRLRHADGALCEVETTVTNLLAEPAVGGFVLNSRDVSERQALARRLAHEATHDALTGLANRALFEQRLAGALHRAHGVPGRVAVVYCDLDGFKEVNDSLGHEAGDGLLVAVAGRLRGCVRGTDLVARLGGDEFAVLLEGVDGEQGAGELTARLTDRLHHVVTLGGREIAVRGSVGLAVARGTEEPRELLRNADLAMYAAKRARGGGHAVFVPGMHADAVARMDLAAALRAAVAAGRIDLHYQPVVALGTGAVVGVEALARWTDPERGVVPPSEFVPLAEEVGLVRELGRLVLGRACAQAAAWRAEHPTLDLTMGVNLSARQLADDDAVDELCDLLGSCGVPTGALVLEMTESVLLEDEPAVRDRLRRLRARGVRLAVDDFGTGYSSLAYLHRFPVDILKIDRSFVGRLGEGVAEDALVPAIVSLASAMGLGAVAEGVETPHQAAALRRLGCTHAQGYHFAPPVPTDEFDAVLADLARRGTGDGPPPLAPLVVPRRAAG